MFREIEAFSVRSLINRTNQALADKKRKATQTSVK